MKYLKRKYLKTLYRFLKQWDSKQEKIFEIERFKKDLNVPVEYKMYNIDQKILKHAVKKLLNYFYDLKLEKIKAGRKVTSLKFTWKQKKNNLSETETVVDILISEKLNKAIEKAKKNRYLTKFLKEKNIEKLIAKFDEALLIKGLNKAYKEIKTFNYLIKTIESAFKEEKRIIVKSNEIEDISLNESRDSLKS